MQWLNVFRAGFGVFAPLIIVALNLAPVPAAQAQSVEAVWTSQFGTLNFDEAHGTLIDASGTYVTGLTSGTLPGETSAGDFDAFVRKYDADGNEVWTRQFGTSGSDLAAGISSDNSGIYITGNVSGSLPGETSAGHGDVFLRRYDTDGNEVWTRQFGSSAFDTFGGVSLDGSGIYVSGGTNGTLPGQTSAGGVRDAFLRKYDVDGNEIWTRQFGSPGFDIISRVSVADSGIYVAGWTDGTLPGQASAGGFDVYVRKYDADGNEIWTRQFGTSSVDQLAAISVDSTGVYVAGNTEGVLPGQTTAGGRDIFVRRYDASGNEVWTRQFGTSSFDASGELTVDGSGIYVAGRTDGTLPGQTNAGGADAFVRKYDVDGNEIWTHQFGTSSFDRAFGISSDASGIAVAGTTEGALPGQNNAGGRDAFITKLREFLEVAIDIKPGSFPNSINPKSGGVIPVAILTTSAFDAQTVNPSTVEFGPSAAMQAHAHAHLEDADSDGDIDLILHFRTQESGIACGDTEANLAGTTFGGQSLQGTDSIRSVGGQCE